MFTSIWHHQKRPVGRRSRICLTLTQRRTSRLAAMGRRVGEVAAKIGRSVSAVRIMRQRRGIANPSCTRKLCGLR